MDIQSPKDVIKANLCIGCGICQSIDSEIKIQFTEDGFLSPQYEQIRPDSWQKIEKVCPGVNLEQVNKPRDKHEVLWGPIEGMWKAHATDEDLRWHGSSGGGISGVLQYLVERNVVDGVIQVGQSGVNPFLNDVRVSVNKTGILASAGSRYAPAAPLVSLRETLDASDKKYAFVGKPCDVAALRAYLRMYPSLNSRIPYLISFFCAGTPSIKGTNAIIDSFAISKEEVKDFWYRGKGWPGRATAITKTGAEKSLSYNDSWGNILNRHLHFRCKICPDGIGALADMTFGDAWEEEGGYPSFSERAGQSFVIARTTQGSSLIQKAAAEGFLEIEHSTREMLEVIQPYQANRRRVVGARILAMIAAGLPHPKYKGFNLRQNAFSASFDDNVENFLGLMARVAKKGQRGFYIYKIVWLFNYYRKKIVAKFNHRSSGPI